MKRRTRKLISGWLCLILCVSMNINPLAILAGAIVDSGMVDRFVNLKNNLIWMAETSGGPQYVFAEEPEPDLPGCSCEFSCDALAALDKLNGNSDVTLEQIMGAITAGNGISSAIKTELSNGVTAINGRLDSVVTELQSVNKKLETLHTDLQAIQSVIEAQNHNYRVAHLYSLNNAMSNALWRPYSNEVDYVDDIAMVSGKFANVYTGYWDTAVTTLTNTNNIKNDNLRTSRVFEILGYDAIVRSEGVVLLKDAVSNGKVTDGTPTLGGTGQNMSFNLTDVGASPNSVIISSLFQEIIPEEDICWIDAVTLLYKALGEEQITYQSFMSRNTSITPETSPAFQNLANPVAGDDGYQGYDFYMFLTRGNVISLQQAKEGETEIPSVNIDYIYWRKAINGGFIPAGKIDAAREPITFDEFFVLASSMMQAYGEPVMNDSELKALLQVYGTHYPIQLGEKVADAWAYLAARGILDVSEYIEGSPSLLYNISNTDYISREQLLLMCTRIKDKDSRTDFKTIDIVLDLSDVMQEDYYYPVYDMAIANGQFSTNVVYDHRASRCFDYVIQYTQANSLGTVGTPMVYSSTNINDNNLINGASYEGMIEVDGQKWYHVRIPKDYTGNAYIAMHLEGDATLVGNSVKYIEIPANTALGGGYYCQCSVGSGSDVATVVADGGSRILFDDNMEMATSKCTDYVRAGMQAPPKGTQVASNATVMEQMMAVIDLWTSPMIANAALIDGNVHKNIVVGEVNWHNTDSGMSNDKGISLSHFYLKDNQSTGVVHGGTWNELIEQQYGAGASMILGDVGETKIFNIDPNSSTSPDTLMVVNPKSNSVRLLEVAGNLTEFLYFSGKTFEDMSLSDLIVDGSIKSGLRSYLNGTPSNGWNYPNNNSTEYFYMTNGIERSRDIAVTSLLLGIPSFGTGAGANGKDDDNLDFNMPEDEAFSTWQKSILDTAFPDGMDEVLTRWANNGINAVVWGRNFDTSYGHDNLSKVPGAPTAYGDLHSYMFKGEESAVDKVFDDLGNKDVVDSLTMNVTKSGIGIDENFYTVSIMDRQENILISWSDMVATGFINETRKQEMPRPNANGSYEFMCEEGRVIVNDNWHTIQIGTTLYDLSYDGGKSPKLVYVDEEQNNMLYFDYRCIMGVCAEEFSVTDGKTFTSSNSLGSGSYVVYDLGVNGVSSKLYSEYPVNTYNYPETNDYTNVCSNVGYTVTLIGETKYDGLGFKDNNNNDKVYWDKGDGTDSVSRFKLASNVPTGNWICVIDDDGNDVSGSLYVYYPRTAFADGYVDKDGNLQTLQEPQYFDEICPDVENVVKDASAIISNGDPLTSVLSRVYGVNWNNFDSTPWYIKMSCYAAAHLYSDTDGLYYLSSDYVIRRFEISDNSIGFVRSWGFTDNGGTITNEIVSSLDPGSIYWVDKIGYVYNMPKVSEWNLGDYLSGKYPLPLALDLSNPSNPCVINFNMNYYGAPARKDADAVNDNVWLPYGVVLCSDVDNPVITWSGATYHTDKEIDIPLKSDGRSPVWVNKEYHAENGDYGEKPRFFIPAPIAIYSRFQNGGVEETMTVAELTPYITASTQVYYGSSLLSFENGEAVSNQKLFKFISDDYSEVALQNSTEVRRVFRSSSGKDVLVVDSNNMLSAPSAGTYKVNMDEVYTNPMEDWLDGLGTSSLIKAIDDGASLLIIIAFKVLPWIGIILMTILIGLAFVCDIKFVRILFEKTFDPVRLLTFGIRSMETWNWRKVLVPCILLYLAFALFLNGNLIRIVMWGAEWYGVISDWAKTL